jgi:hypothetical protein
MINLERFWRGTVVTNYAGGFIVPFLLVIVGLIFLFSQLGNKLERASVYEGTISKVTGWEDNVFYLKGYEKPFKFVKEERIEVLDQFLKPGCTAKVWVKKTNDYIYQLAVNGEVVFPYEKSMTPIYVALVAIGIGLIFIPIVIRERRKHPELFNYTKEDIVKGKKKR